MSSRGRTLKAEVVIKLPHSVLALAQTWTLGAQPGHGLKIVDSHEVKVRGGVLQVDFAEGKLDEPQDDALGIFRQRLRPLPLITVAFRCRECGCWWCRFRDGAAWFRALRGATWRVSLG